MYKAIDTIFKGFRPLFFHKDTYVSELIKNALRCGSVKNPIRLHSN